MARYRGPRMKKCRRVGMVLPGLSSAGTLRRQTPPGVHGQRRVGKQSDYKLRLMEKQKVRWHYGVLERQFVNYVREASRRRGPRRPALCTQAICQKGPVKRRSVLWIHQNACLVPNRES